MLFNSFDFFIFFPIVFILHWFVFKNNKLQQNLFLLFVSYLFYSFWDWRFTLLLAFSTALDYYSGIIISNSPNLKTKRYWTRISIFTNIGILCYFKYTNFFIDSFLRLFNNIGFQLDPLILNIILPIGISFYTFHGVSYVLDIYYGRTKATNNILEYSLFVSFFPLLVAGPIERASHLLPQLTKRRVFNYLQAVEGCRLVLWGLFKKVVIADSLAPVVEDIFNNYENLNGITCIIGIVGFAFQVYGDFSGYTDIARGISKLLGIELILNFNFPYFSRSIPEFWSRWHISLSSWLNDYLFTPLALKFRNYGKFGMFLGVFTTFIIAGFWHGAGWKFIVYGAYFGLLYVPYIYSKNGIKSMVNKKSKSIEFQDILNMIMTFSLVCIGFVFFRADGLSQAVDILIHVLINIKSNASDLVSITIGKSTIVYITFLLIADWSLYMKLQNTKNKIAIILQSQLTLCFIAIITMWFTFGTDESQNFIYFQF